MIKAYVSFNMRFLFCTPGSNHKFQIKEIASQIKKGCCIAIKFMVK